eukprot:GHVU01199267.1.p1 GENE.GHVU01199267.1~~GHVU01199267.1.p1  ORF type:complete len:165 (+),score=3.77 GHVU01199267.1:330-824(+)
MEWLHHFIWGYRGHVCRDPTVGCPSDSPGMRVAGGRPGNFMEFWKCPGIPGGIAKVLPKYGSVLQRSDAARALASRIRLQHRWAPYRHTIPRAKRKPFNKETRHTFAYSAHLAESPSMNELVVDDCGANPPRISQSGPHALAGRETISLRTTPSAARMHADPSG